MKMKCEDVLARIRLLGSERDRAGMARFGINTENACGVSLTALRQLAKDIGRDHALALQLWRSGLHEARLLASIIDDPARVTERQMERWVKDFDSWDICDVCCSNLFDATPFAHRKAVEWAARDEEFVKRAGFAMMAALAVHDKAAPDAAFEKFLPIIRREATDARNFVRKAVNWALRQIGKRNLRLNRKGVAAAKMIRRIDSKAARWIAADALRELTSDAVQRRLRRTD